MRIRNFLKNFYSPPQIWGNLVGGWVGAMMSTIITAGYVILLHSEWWIIGISILLALVVGAYLGASWTNRIEFYENRNSSPFVWDDIAEAREVWAIWHTASVIGTNGELGKRKIGAHITKLVLLSSQSPSYLKLHASLARETQKRDLQSDIDLADKRLKVEGVRDIRHRDYPLLPMVIFNPKDKHGWIRLEPWGAFLESGERPIFIIRKNKNPKAFNALLNSFNKIWGDGDNEQGQITN